jgi:serine/threonine-protein kinase HipA
MASATLHVVIADQVVGELTRGPRRRLSFSYQDAWRNHEDAYPLSLSLPLAAAEHEHAAVSAYLWGLLPESPLVLERWARRFQVSAADPFALLAVVGADCPGAVQFVEPEKLAALRTRKKREVAWLSEQEIGLRLHQLRVDHAAWRSPSDSGQFSLAGAQPKTALLYDAKAKRYGVPAGRTPTTHILKPPLPELDGHAENEHLCLNLARALGLPSASSRVERFGAEVAIVVERYDRVLLSGEWLRVHQEDTCQALSVPPSAKYQTEGGPSARDIVELLRVHSSRPHEDIQTFVDALLYNWLIAGTDAHAKNYSLLIGAGGRVRLAPLYDVASAYAYRQLEPAKLKLAMKIGSSYRLRELDRRSWTKLARELRIDAEQLLARALAMTKALPDSFATVKAGAAEQGLHHPNIERLQKQLSTQAAHCARRLA